MSKQQAQSEAIRRAKEALAGIDFNARAAALGLPRPSGTELRFRMFGTDYILSQPGFELVDAKTLTPAKTGDHILALHYLLSDVLAEPTGEFITFRDLPGGQFYWQPFLSRSIKPLLSRIGSDLDLLENHLARFDWQHVSGGDFAARVHSIGKIYLTLVYHLGDEEFPPDAGVLFDSSIKRLYNTEDAAFLASRICLGLL